MNNFCKRHSRNLIVGALLGLIYGIVGFGLTDWQFWLLLISTPIVTMTQNINNLSK